jgi:hypothetical protein
MEKPCFNPLEDEFITLEDKRSILEKLSKPDGESGCWFTNAKEKPRILIGTKRFCIRRLLYQDAYRTLIEYKKHLVHVSKDGIQDNNKQCVNPLHIRIVQPIKKKSKTKRVRKSLKEIKKIIDSGDYSALNKSSQSRLKTKKIYKSLFKDGGDPNQHQGKEKEN